MNAKKLIGLTITELSTIGLLFFFNNGSIMAQTIDLATLGNTALSNHNAYRTKHNSPPLTISSSLNSTAQAWAEQIASSGVFAHSSTTQRNGAGENIYAFFSTGAIASDTLASNAVKSWYDEINQYNYGVPGFSSKTGHFTQVVWKNSTQLGCGAAIGTKTASGVTYNAFYVVCQYNPAGNISGQFADNVLKP